MSHDPIADALAARAAEIGRRAVEAMYADPFWDARFGPDGRRRADEDGDFHIGYLTEALRLGSPRTFANYAQWLRGLLVPRGMCTRHVSLQLASLGDAAAGALPAAGADVVRVYVRAARDALRYPAASPGRALQDAETEAGERVAAALGARFSADVLPPYDRLRADAAELLSYLADSVALARPDLFVAYARWVAGFHAAQRRPSGYTAALRDALGTALTDAGYPLEENDVGLLLSLGDSGAMV